MQKYVAFELFKRNAQGGHQPVFKARPDGFSVCLVSDVEDFVFRIPEYLLDENDSHFCPELKAAVRDLMER
jgi:hypothetical protein